MKIMNPFSHVKPTEPKKKTYRAMQKYYEAMNDKDLTQVYKSLDNQAKARLHSRKSDLLQTKLFDFSEEISGDVFSKKDTFKNIYKMAKLTLKSAYEYALGLFYSIRG